MSLSVKLALCSVNVSLCEWVPVYVRVPHPRFAGHCASRSLPSFAPPCRRTLHRVTSRSHRTRTPPFFFSRYAAQSALLFCLGLFDALSRTHYFPPACPNGERVRAEASVGGGAARGRVVAWSHRRRCSSWFAHRPSLHTGVLPGLCHARTCMDGSGCVLAGGERLSLCWCRLAVVVVVPCSFCVVLLDRGSVRRGGPTSHTSRWRCCGSSLSSLLPVPCRRRIRARCHSFILAHPSALTRDDNLSES